MPIAVDYKINEFPKFWSLETLKIMNEKSFEDWMLLGRLVPWQSMVNHSWSSTFKCLLVYRIMDLPNNRISHRHEIEEEDWKDGWTRAES